MVDPTVRGHTASLSGPEGGGREGGSGGREGVEGGGREWREGGREGGATGLNSRLQYALRSNKMYLGDEVFRLLAPPPATPSITPPLCRLLASSVLSSSSSTIGEN